MFLPQCPEIDIRDASGQQTEDINSVLEWVNVEMGNDNTPDDEDDDNGNNFLVIKNFDYKILQQQYQIVTENPITEIKKKDKFPLFQESNAKDAFIEVMTPPPNSTS